MGDRIELDVPARPEFLSLVRSIVTLIAETGSKLPDRRIEDLRLAVTEACANAILHSGTPEITVTNNNFRNDGDYQTALVRNITATPATLKGNKLAGSVIPLKGDGNVQ